MPEQPSEQIVSSWSRYAGRRKPKKISAATVGAVPTSEVGNTVAQLVNGALPPDQLPGRGRTDVISVNSEAEQLALVVEEGDVCRRLDLGKDFWHNGGTSGTMADWDPVADGAWEALTGATRGGAAQINMTGIGSRVVRGSLVRYQWGATKPTTDSAYLYGLVDVVSADSITLFLGESIPEGATTLWVDRNISDQNLHLDNSPILGPWASAVVTTDAYDMYCGWHNHTEKPKARFIGAYNLYSRIADTGAVQPTVNFVVGTTTFLGTPVTVAAEPTDPMTGACTGMVTSGIDAVKNTRVKILVPGTGTNKTSTDLQLCLVFVILDN